MNFFIASVVEAMGECYTLCDALGVSRPALAAFFEQSFASPGLKGYAQRMNERQSDGADGFTMAACLKDVRLVRDAAASVKCPVEIADVVADKMEDAVVKGMGGWDCSAVQEIMRQRAGLTTQAG
jgi:3-hydroxyisobutyrate dehydrogenase-like beta-hydroxyacid dehydrogenase